MATVGANGVVPSTSKPQLARQPLTTALLWFGMAMGVSFSLPVLWMFTLRFIAHNDPVTGVIAAMFSLTIVYGNVLLRRWIKRRRIDWYEVLLSMDFLMFGGSWCSIVNNISLMYYKPEPMLGDLGFYLLPELHPNDNWYVLSDLLVNAIGPMVLVYTVLVVNDPWARSTVGRKCFARVGAVQLMRGFTTAVTRLPGPALHCRPGPHLNFGAPKEYIEIIAQLGHMAGAVKNCGDLIFSGHSGSLMACLSVLVPDMIRGRGLWFSRMVKGGATVYAVTFACLVVASRKHYTVDVVVAYLLVLCMGETFDRPWTLMRSFFPDCGAKRSPSNMPRRPRTRSNAGYDDDGVVVEFETRSLNV